MTQLEKNDSILESRLADIEAIITIVRRRKRLNPEDAEEFRSYVFEKLSERNEAILRKFEGRSSLQAYLTTVVNRLLLDFRTARWGKYRSSAQARRLGAAALLLEKLLRRDGHDLRDAIQIMRVDFDVDMSSRELLRLAHRLPRIGRPRIEPLEQPDVLRHDSTPDDVLRREDAERTSRRLERHLRDSLDRLGDEDRFILRLRFADRVSVRKIASVLGVPAKPLYKRIERCLIAIRRELHRRGVSTRDASEVWLFKTSFDVDRIFRRNNAAVRSPQRADPSPPPNEGTPATAGWGRTLP